MNLPNTLSLIRICMVPLFVLVFFSGLPHAALWAALIYVLAALTDCLDGYIARHYNMVTNLGRVLDPLGDKLLLFAALICLTVRGPIPFWALAIFFVKEACMGLGGLLLHRRARVEIPPSNYIGKTATVLFFIICISLMLFPQIPQAAAVAMICLCLAISLIAFVTYLRSFLKLMRKNQASSATGD